MSRASKRAILVFDFNIVGCKLAGGLYVYNLICLNKIRGFVMAKAIEYKMISVEEVDDVTVVRFRDQRFGWDCDVYGLRRELFQVVEENGRKILLSFAGVEIVTSSVLGEVINLYRKLEEVGSVLKLSNMCSHIAEVFSITKLDEKFDIKDDEAGALAAF